MSENDIDFKKIGQNLRQERLKRGLSQERAAEDFEVDVKTWQRYERGLILIPTTKLIILHKKWQLDLNHLFDAVPPTSVKGRVKRSQNIHEGSVFGSKKDRKIQN